MISRWNRLLILLVVWLLVWTAHRLLIRVGGRINWVLLVMAIRHHRLHGHPIAWLGVWGIILSSWLDRGHLFISNWLVFDWMVRR